MSEKENSHITSKCEELAPKSYLSGMQKFKSLAIWVWKTINSILFSLFPNHLYL